MRGGGDQVEGALLEPHVRHAAAHVQPLPGLEPVRPALDAHRAGGGADVDHAQFAAFQEEAGTQLRRVGQAGGAEHAAHHDPVLVRVDQPRLARGEQVLHQESGA
nr:hypothetical protein [Nonomuraea jiangxiensis]